MNFSSHITQRMRHLAPPPTRKLAVEPDLPVRMRDGAVLRADRWAPASGGGGLPTALIRTPYGRSGSIETKTARGLAERGFQVLIQSSPGHLRLRRPFRFAALRTAGRQDGRTAWTPWTGWSNSRGAVTRWSWSAEVPRRRAVGGG
ncbi:CocE/NonD family hydrolase [Streptomyces scopuliridis]|uniref:CocE/NonD family hydrolase n=1 Tax=Streptomyces scopuliridis TaxID=452529 RepID=UPI00367A9E5A